MTSSDGIVIDASSHLSEVKRILKLHLAGMDGAAKENGRQSGTPALGFLKA